MPNDLKDFFVNPVERRLRSGWRLLLQTALILVIGIGLAILAVLIELLLPQVHLGLLAGQMAELLAITGSIFIARRLFDRRSIASLGLRLGRSAIGDLLAGIGITFLMMGSIFTLEWATGWVSFEAFAWQVDPLPVVVGQTALTLLVFVLVGWNEELLSRGYHLQTLASGINLFWGVLLSSSIFGLLHLGNPNATWIGAVGVCLAGFFLAMGYLRTRQLWLPIGLHIGWNFFEGAVFGFPVSGLNTYRLLRISVTGPVIWTGGAFGPEAGLVLLPGLLIGFGLLFAYTRGRLQDEDNLEKPIDII